MIVRQFRAWAEGDRAAEYVQHFASQVQPRLNRVEGYRKALVLTRKQGTETEIVVMTLFDRLENVKGFAANNTTSQMWTRSRKRSYPATTRLSRTSI